MKISIITTTYNSLLTIGDTLDSILNQSYGDFESIIIDGISTDGTLDVIKEYQLKFNGKLRCLSEPDCGIYDAMNKGIKMATGDIIGVLNSDDFFTHSDVLKKVVERFENDEALDAVYGDVHFVKSNNLNKCVRYYFFKNIQTETNEIGLYACTSIILYEKKVF